MKVLKDFWTCCVSREASLLARKEVLTGKAKFGITGDGKEVPQVALARAFKKGDWRSGYYRDQTLMFALGLATVEEFFAQLYADPDNDPFSGGRQMNSHFGTPNYNADGSWTDHLDQYNSSSDISSTAGQMSRALGLALASKMYRESPDMVNSNFSKDGNEVCFVTIGDASTSEGVFWETLNAAGVLQVPMAVSVWDDGYGISVPKKYQTIKESISDALAGFKVEEGKPGFEIYKVKGWDYPALCEVYEKGIAKMRKTHVPALFHVEELTQPQGHSTSGSHERYKDKERLEWEKEHDCIKVFRQWIIDSGISTEEEVDELVTEAKSYARLSKQNAWKKYRKPVLDVVAQVKLWYADLMSAFPDDVGIQKTAAALDKAIDPLFGDLVSNVREMVFALKGRRVPAAKALIDWLDTAMELAEQRYHTHLYSETPKSALKVPMVPAVYSESSKKLNGYQVLNTCFDNILDRDPNVVAFGEDVGHIGDVNQGFAGLQEKYGVKRVFDTGIRELTIMGQAVGLGIRGIRPIAEIQYLDYLIYGLQTLSDDLATIRYRSNGTQRAPVIIRTRGHRLEGIWHAGSPIGMILNSLRGMYICVPRNMTQAVGMYNTLLQSDDPALVIECLNGYRLKEVLPDNVAEFSLPLGMPEVLSEGDDITLVTYGSCVRIAQAGVELLKQHGISVELIDVQTLLPFDLEEVIVTSLKKTNRILFVDEDVPGGASAYMMQKVLEEQKGYQYLDSLPYTLTARAHRSPYGSDGDYFSKPSKEDIFEKIYGIIREAEPDRLPEL